MAATRALTIPDVYDRFVKGKKVKVEDWDYKVIPENLTALKEKRHAGFTQGRALRSRVYPGIVFSPRSPPRGRVLCRRRRSFETRRASCPRGHQR